MICKAFEITAHRGLGFVFAFRSLLISFCFSTSSHLAPRSMGQCCGGTGKSENPPPTATNNNPNDPVPPTIPATDEAIKTTEDIAAKSNSNLKANTGQAVGSASSSHLSPLKLERGPQVKYLVNEERIKALIKEKQLLREDVAFFGAGGRPKSAASVLKSNVSPNQGLGDRSGKSSKSKPSSGASTGQTAEKSQSKSCQVKKSPKSTSDTPHKPKK